MVTNRGRIRKKNFKKKKPVNKKWELEGQKNCEEAPREEKPREQQNHKIWFWANIIAGILGVATGIGFGSRSVFGVGDIIAIVCGLLALCGVIVYADRRTWKTTGAGQCVMFCVMVYLTAMLLAAFVVQIFLFLKSEKGSVPAEALSSETVQTTDAQPSISGRESQFHKLKFVFNKDPNFDMLEYYNDGIEIPEEQKGECIRELIRVELEKKILPDRYVEAGDEILNQGAYATHTATANEYDTVYKEMKNMKYIEGTDKVEFLLKKTENKEMANEEYVTLSNLKDLMWFKEEVRNDLWVYKEETNDPEMRLEWKETAIEANCDLKCVCWEILMITYATEGIIAGTAKEKMIEAYEWEKMHVKKDEVCYDSIVYAFQCLE